MTFTSRAQETLRTCETALRRLLAEAAQAGEYDAVVLITRWGSELARMASSSARDANSDATSSSGTFSRTTPASRSVIERAGTGPEPRTGRVRKPHRRSRASSGSYPRFVRSGSDLVKIGWSKRSRAEYQHRASREIVSRIVSALLKAGDELVRIEDVLPEIATPANGPIPSYRVYVVLAWFRAEGLVRQQGRQGYSVGTPEAFIKEVEERWKALPEL